MPDISSFKLEYLPENPPVVSLFCLSCVTDKRTGKVTLAGTGKSPLPRFQYSVHSASQAEEGEAEADDISVARSICLTVPPCQRFLTGNASSSGYERAQVEHWVDIAVRLTADVEKTKAFRFETAPYHQEIFHRLENHLTLRTYCVGHQLTLADVALYTSIGKLYGFTVAAVTTTSDLGMHVKRWWSFIAAVNPTPLKIMKNIYVAYPGHLIPSVGVKGAVSSNAPENAANTASQSVKEAAAKSKKYEGKLPGAVQGQVVTRFPPEPSGYLHIGHAKAALLNAYYARLYDGKLIIRFDDTNPAKENMEFETSILEDLVLLDIVPDRITHTSDYFQHLQDLCEEMIKKGIFYADTTAIEEMRAQRGEGIESRCRSQSVEENLRLWEQMKQGTEEGSTCCIRAKIDMQHKNKCLRDPAMYRCILNIPHHIHGDKFKAYPTYDFACPIVDALEGVTHAMRTNEYADRIPQYQWVLQNCGSRDVTIYEFSRLNFVHTVLSKRKLQWFVDQGIVESWEDPRFPTVRGIRRRGLTVEALREFVLEQGPSKNSNLMEWDKLWAKNKQLIDPIVPRYMAVAADAVQVTISNGPSSPYTQERDLHPKNPSVGRGLQVYSNCILLDRDDANTLQLNEEITLMRWCNAIVECISGVPGKPNSVTLRLNPEGDFKKTKKKLHWVASTAARPIILRECDHLISKKKLEEEDRIEDYCCRDSLFDTAALADPESVDTLKPGCSLQFERRGYFRLDTLGDDAGQLPVFIKIPDGRTKSMSVVQSKVDAATLAKGV